MKFTDLTSNSRSMLTALCASVGTGLDTAELSRCTTPRKLDCAQTACVLLEMRKQGLVYSNQKPLGKSYALWEASDYGLAVFTGRHDTDVPAPSTAASACAAPTIGYTTAKLVKAYIVRSNDGSSYIADGIRADALSKAQNMATAEPGREYKVYELIAVAHMPVPQAQITML